jgi:predicted RNA-binding protein with PIN domain
MAIHIIIDGYNFIRQSSVLSPLDHQDIQLGREALIDSLCTYKRIKGHPITIVFDGIHSDTYSESREYRKGIEIIFSRHGKSADSVIKKMASVKRDKALVVSSDKDVIRSAASNHAATISSPEFENKISSSMLFESVNIEDETDGGWVPTTKKKGPRRKLSKKKRRNRIKIKKL